MVFKTSQEAFRSIFGEGKKDRTLIEQFFIELARYLDTAEDVTEAKKISDWIRDGNRLSCFSCRSDLTEDMSWELLDNGIPFVAVTEKEGRIGYVIRSCDEKKAGEARDAVLESKARYCRILTGKALKEKMAENKEKDKDVLYISGLTAEEADILRERCEETLDGNDIGIDEMEDGTYTFSFIGKKALKRTGRDNMNLARALLEAMMAANGPNRAKNLRQARNRLAMEQAIGRRFRKQGVNLDRTPAWAMGRDNQYMRIDSTGFEYGRAVIDAYGEVHLNEEYTADISMPEFDAQLMSFLTRFKDGAYTYDTNEAMRHYAAPDKSSAVVRTDKDDRIIRRAEREIAAAVDEAVMTKAERDPVSQIAGRWDEKLENYIHNTASILDAVAYPESAQKTKARGSGAELINGFRKHDVENLSDVIGSYDVDLELYADAVGRLQDIGIHTDRPVFERFDRDGLESRLKARSDGRDIDVDKEEERRRFSGERSDRT